VNGVLERAGSWGTGFLVAPATAAAPNLPNGAVGAAGADGRALNWNGVDEEGGPAGVVEGTEPNMNGFTGVALELVNENVGVSSVTAPVLETTGSLAGCTPVTPRGGKVKPPNVSGVVVAGGGAEADVNEKPEAESRLIGLLSASLSAALEGALNEKPGLLSGEGVEAGTVVLGAGTRAA
jgi:hypothetical protein